MQKLHEVPCEKLRKQKLSSLQASFVAQVSHEFRTPMTIILLSAQLLELYGHEYTAEEKLKYIHQIQDAVRKMNNLFDDALEKFRDNSSNLVLPFGDLTQRKN